MAARGQTYGKRQEQIQAQRAVPMQQAPTDIAAKQTAPTPTPVTPLGAPTARPAEPITAGAPFGPGPNMIPGVPMSEPAMMDDAIREMRAIYEMHPSQELAEIIQFYEDAF